ncbi:hypothetical protein ACIA5D_32825 [Actinoplanes sp. NPDC051513]|uniref:hypothetical protein n=1 Tax=Actinoplanes sp. NPDC051513 TaxID=3363908 RepID=UPI0037BC6003
MPVVRTPARDRAAEIDAAIDAVVTGAGPVVLANGSAARRIRFVTDTPPIDGWLPFGAAVGETAVDGDTLLVGLGAAAIEHARRAGLAAGALLRGGDIGVEAPPGRPDLLAPLIDGLVTGYPGAESVTLRLPEPDLADAEQGRLAADVARLAAG